MARDSKMERSTDRRLMLAGLGLAGAAVLARTAKAGPLDPPPGPISSTGKTTQELYDRMSFTATKVARTDSGVAEPRTPLSACPGSQDAQFVITQPGAYCLTENLTSVPGKCCIEIQCDHVDIDGQGFTFQGIGQSLACIRANGRRGIEIYDCAFRGWQARCLQLASCPACFVSDCLFDSCFSPPDAQGFRDCSGLGSESEFCDCDVRDCEGSCVSVGPNSCVMDCTCVGGSGGGYRCGDGTCICDCDVLSNSGSTMIFCGDRCTVSECRTSQCSGGLCISVGSSCTLDCCSCTACGAGALSMGSDCCCTECDVLGCGGDAITCLDRCCIDDCDVRSCTGVGIHAGAGNVIKGCWVGLCSSSAMVCADGCCCTDCDMTQCTGYGLQCGSGCSITDNRCVQCAGIDCQASCVVCSNEMTSCDGSGGGGGGGAITCRGAACCVEDNSCISCNIGIYIFGGAERCCCDGNSLSLCTGAGIVVDASVVSCLCVRNTCTTPPGTATGFVFGSSAHGPVVACFTPDGTGDISSIPNSNHPCANFLY